MVLNSSVFDNRWQPHHENQTNRRLFTQRLRPRFDVKPGTVLHLATGQSSLIPELIWPAQLKNIPCHRNRFWYDCSSLQVNEGVAAVKSD
jgi:hypothetical protein